MCHSFFFSLLFGFLLAKVLFRWRFGGGGCAGRGGWGACGGLGRFGGPGGWGAGPGMGSGIGRGFGFGPPFPAAFNGQGGGVRPVEDLVRGLELNARQQEEAAPVLNQLVQVVGRAGARLEFALGVVAAETFERGRLEGLLADAPADLRRQLIDGLEHLHNILIPEQRAQLGKALGQPERTPAASA